MKMLVLDRERLMAVLPQLSSERPRSLQMEIMIRNHLSGVCAWPGIEFVVDEFPAFSVVLCRPIKDSKDHVLRSRMYAVSMYCRNAEVLFEVSNSKDFVDWHQPIVFSAVEKGDVSAALEKRCAERGTLMETSEDEYCYAFVLDAERVEKFDAPDGYRLGELSVEHAEQVNAEWTYGAPECLPYFRFIINSGFPNAAVFETDSNVPVAYILYAGDGSLGSGFVKPEHRRRGLFQLVCSAAAEKVRKIGQDVVWVYVDKRNIASMNAFEKMGARKVDPKLWSIDWLIYSPEVVDAGDYEPTW